MTVTIMTQQPYVVSSCCFRRALILTCYFFIHSRPHIKKNKEKSTYRKCWEWFHRLWGFSTIVLGLTQVTLGVFLIVPPLGVWVVWILTLASWVIAFIIHEIAKCTCACVKKKDIGNEFELKTRHL